MGGGRITGDDERLDLLLHEIGSDLETVSPHRLRALRTIPHARPIDEVSHALPRKLLHHRVSDGEAADAGVEDSDRRFWCHHVSEAPTVAPPGATRTESSAGSSQRF